MWTGTLVTLVLLPLAHSTPTNVFNTSTDAAPCICDLTSSSCDAFCCCDSDCSETQIDLWDRSDSELNTCKPQKLTHWERKACVKHEEIYMDSAIEGMTVIHDTINQLFCIEEDNSFEDDYFYTDIEDVPSDSVTTRETEVLDYIDTYTAPTRNQTSTSTFLPGDILISYLSNKPQLDYIWPLPSPDVYGRCSDMNSVRWMYNQNLEPCVRPTSTCKGALDPASYTGLKIANSPLINNAQDRVSITRGDVQLLQADGSLRYEVSNADITSVGSSCQCSGILYEAHFTVVTDSTSTVILSVKLDMVIGDTNKCAIKQRFSVKFVSAAVVKELSGNPGYLPGKPILFKAGDSAEELTTLKIGGVGLDGSCTAGVATNDTVQYLQSSPTVTSQIETIFTCYREMTLSELSTLCQANSKNYNSLLFNYPNLPKYVAKFGKVNLTNTDDFVPLIQQTSHMAQSFTEPSCTLENTLVLEFVTAEEGSVSNPQTKIVFARAFFVSNT